MSDTTVRTIERQRASWRVAPAVYATLGLIAAADLLVFGYAPGINVALLLTIVAAATVALNWRHAHRRTLLLGGGAFLAGALPLVEAPTLPGLLSSIFGLATLALAVRSRLPRSAVDLPAILMRFAALAPFRLAGDGDSDWRSWSLRRSRLHAYLLGSPIETLPVSGQNRVSTQ